MVVAIRYLRAHVYPRGVFPRRPLRAGANRPQASDAVLGMTVVMLVVLAVAYAITLAAA